METGLRAGEALALKWGDIDQEKRTLKVTRGVEIKVISKPPGHASTQTTYDRYVHLFDGDIDDTLRQAVGV